MPRRVAWSLIAWATSLGTRVYMKLRSPLEGRPFLPPAMALILSGLSENAQATRPRGPNFVGCCDYSSRVRRRFSAALRIRARAKSSDRRLSCADAGVERL